MSSLDSLLAPESLSPDLGHPDELIARAERVAREVLAPCAQETDRAEIVPKRNLGALAEAGLLGLSGPVEYGGQAAPGWASRRVAEVVAGACGVTHFVQAQHHGPVGMIAGSDNAALKVKYLRDMCEGRILAGVAFSHLRRPQPMLEAVPVEGGYRVTGEAPWVTSWGLAGIFVVAATLPEDRILYFCREGTSAEGFQPSPPLQLSVMNASSTVRLFFTDLFVPEEMTVRITDASSWRERDRINTAHANPAVFGIAEASLAGMEALLERSPSPSMQAAIEALERELLECRDAAYRMTNVTEDQLPELLDIKAWSLDLVARTAHAYVAAVGGRAMGVDHPAQRLMREAMFYTIQAQTGAVRESTLNLLRHPRRP